MAESLLKELRKGENNVIGKFVMFFTKSEKEPAMLEDIENGTEVPKGRNDERDVF